MFNVSITTFAYPNIQNLADLNTPYNDFMPFISPDEKIIFFQSDRPNGESGYGDFDIWMSEKNISPIRSLNRFQPPENLNSPINTSKLEGMASLRFLSQDEWDIYFTSVSDNDRQGAGETDIFYSKRKGGVWSTPVQLKNLNTAFHERMPYISIDGTILLFNSNRPGGLGGEDIWVSFYDPENHEWSSPFNLGEDINTKYDEASPSIHHDNNSLFFSSNRPGGVGGYDLYFSFRMDRSFKEWKPPSNLGKPYNTSSDEERVSMSGDGKTIYFSSNRVDGVGLFDIYRGDAPAQVVPRISVLFQGSVFEQDTNKGVEANVKITDKMLTHNISTYLPKGNFNIDLESGKSYQISITAPGYIYKRDLLDLSKIIQEDQIVKKIYYLKKPKKSLQTEKSKESFLSNPAWIVYYNSNEYTVSQKDIEPLNKIYKKWKSDKTLNVEIGGHTDREGSKNYNIRLSRKRAEYIGRTLLKMGIPTQKIKIFWYDFSRPVAVEDNDKGRSKNRRVEIYLKKN